ncbi:MAG: hypothetical protein K5659_09140 [Lachnospiraceae bacterium]|nr:hypothetical protein [Lachnospiraceae bacterium]
MAFILFVTVSPMWSLNVNATGINNTDEQIQQQEQQADQESENEENAQNDQELAQNDESQGQQAGQESENEENAQNDQEQAVSQENPDEQIQQDQPAQQAQQVQQQELAAGGEGGEQGEEEPLEIPQINNMQNMVLMSAPRMLAAAPANTLGAAGDPEEGEGDGEENPPHTMHIQIDGTTPDMNVNINWSFDDGATWIPYFNEDGSSVPVEIGENGTSYFFDLEEKGEVPATGSVILDVEITCGEEGRFIVAANDNPWYNWENPEGEEPHDLMEFVSINEEEGWSHFTYRFDNVADAADYHIFGLAMDPLDRGKREILGESESYLYAYSTDITAPDWLLARELYCRFISVPMFGRFGLPIGDVWNPDEAGAVEEGIAQLHDRVEYKESYTIDVNMSDGSVQQRNVDVFQVTWGNDEEGKEIVGYYDIIILNDEEEIIVKTSAENPTYYSRSAFTDQVPFTSDEGDNFPAIVIFDAPIGDGALIGGNGCDVTLTGSDAGLIAVDLNTPEWMKAATGTDYGTKIRFLSSGESYIAVAGSGETKAYGGLGENGVVTDKIFTTGENAEARVYIGESTVYLEPLVVGPVADGIASVELKDPSQKEGVEIDASNLDKVKLTFKSNFYDSVPLTITYKSGKKKDITILRIGVVLSYRYLGGATDFDEGEREDFLWSDTRPDDKVSFKYNYFQGQQVLVYAIYYHPTNDLTASGGDDLYLNVEYDDGHKEIIPHYAYIPENDNAVGVSWFIIGYAPAKHFDGNVWTDDITEQTYVNKYGNAGGLSMTVLNAGFNDNTTFGGTQVGAGKGVHWDGKITWF